MNLSELGEDASLQTVEEKAQVQNNSSEGGELFHLNSLPPGYRFNPADAEIIVFYLRKKVDHQPLPPKKIIEVNVYAYNPEELAVVLNYGFSRVLEWFYFTPRDRKYRNGQRPDRSVGDGYWKATEANKEIKFEERNVGYRKALLTESKRNGSCMNSEFLNLQSLQEELLDDCVVCRVYRKDERISERSRYESRLDESSSSSSKIPRLELDPNPNEADNPYEE
ncbi:NAC domain-containing protein 2-like [Vitis riparia]|uniref:NAC domain-containing protein 2-like n=1 Tax=Vitis riparia TaxID=96939 RepID=UPI00155AA2E0|nr:NAC domain-containing protein 2-like [Vitis riparia]